MSSISPQQASSPTHDDWTIPDEHDRIESAHSETLTTEASISASPGGLGPPIDPHAALAAGQAELQAHQPSPSLPLPPENKATQTQTERRLHFITSPTPQQTSEIQQIQASLKSQTTITPRPQWKKRLSQLTTFLTGGFTGTLRTIWTWLTNRKPPIPATKKTFNCELNFSRQSSLDILETGQTLNGFSTPINAATRFANLGVYMGGDGISAYLRYLQKITARLRGTTFEYETKGMPSQQETKGQKGAIPPSTFLQPQKIAYLREEARQGRNALYAIPWVLPGAIGHITTILIDFKSKKIGFFDSKGKTIEQADFAYSLPFSLKQELEHIGHVCFDEPHKPWSPDILDNKKKCQKNTVDCGRWVSAFLDLAATSGSLDAAFNHVQMKTPDIDKFVKKTKDQLVSDAFFEAILSDYEQYQKAGLISQLKEEPSTSS